MRSDNDEDGEHHAGGQLAELLRIMEVTNLVIVVSRWYGGVHLGPTRFKHIKNAARDVINIIRNSGDNSEIK